MHIDVDIPLLKERAVSCSSIVLVLPIVDPLLPFLPFSPPLLRPPGLIVVQVEFLVAHHLFAVLYANWLLKVHSLRLVGCDLPVLLRLLCHAAVMAHCALYYQVILLFPSQGPWLRLLMPFGLVHNPLDAIR